MDIFLQTLPTVPVPETPPHSTADLSNPSSNEPDSMDRPLVTQATVGGTMTNPQAGASSWQLLQLQAERLHFHTFMLGVHQQLHQLQQSLPRVVGRSRAGLPVYRQVQDWMNSAGVVKASSSSPLSPLQGLKDWQHAMPQLVQQWHESVADLAHTLCVSKT